MVDPARVQESGLLKDDIRLDFPAETGTFDTVLLTRAVAQDQGVDRSVARVRRGTGPACRAR